MSAVCPRWSHSLQSLLEGSINLLQSLGLRFSGAAASLVSRQVRLLGLGLRLLLHYTVPDEGVTSVWTHGANRIMWGLFILQDLLWTSINHCVFTASHGSEPTGVPPPILEPLTQWTVLTVQTPWPLFTNHTHLLTHANMCHLRNDALRPRPVQPVSHCPPLNIEKTLLR